MVLFQICVRWFGPSTKMAPTAKLSLTQDPMGNSHKNLLFWNQLLNWNQTLIKYSLHGPLPKLCLVVPLSDQDGCTAELSLTQDPMGNSHKKTSCLEPVVQLEPNFDGIVIGWSSSKIVSSSRALPPRWLPQCSCVVIESSFDPGERLQAPGSLWFQTISNYFPRIFNSII